MIMKKRYFIFVLLLWVTLCSSLFATNHYLGFTGSGTGTSWTDKALYSTFPWYTVASGDTIFYDGGTGSVVYSGKLSIQDKHYASQVVVTKGKEAGHNGRVIFNNTGNFSTSLADLYWTFKVDACDNIKFIGLEFTTSITSDVGIYNMDIVKIKNSRNIIVDSCIITSNGIGTCFEMSGDTTCTLSYNHIEVLPNSYLTQNDCIWIGNGAGGHTIIRNTIIAGGVNSDSTHKDIIQMNAEGSTSKLKTVIAYNLLTFLNYSAQKGQGIYCDAMASNVFWVYNNIITMRTRANTGFIYNGDGVNASSVRLFNNTILCSAPNSDGLEFGRLDTLIMENNIVQLDSAYQPNMRFLTPKSGFKTLIIDYNQYYRPSDVAFNDDVTAIYWSTWHSIYDTHGNYNMATFTNKWGGNISDYQLVLGSIGINTGTTISTIPANDIVGTKRPIGAAWDIGAYEGSITNYYLGFTSTGSGSGSNWANMAECTTFDWSQVIEGDSILFNGGTDSVTYAPLHLAGDPIVVSWIPSTRQLKRFTSQVVITKGKDVGYNGQVIFQNNDSYHSSGTNGSFVLNRLTNIKLTGLTFNTISTVDDSSTAKYMISVIGSNNVIDNCKIISNGLGDGIFAGGDTNIIITNNRIEVLHNNYKSDADCIYLTNGKIATIVGDTLINGKINDKFHADLIQFGDWGDIDRPTNIISDNFMSAPYQDSKLMTGINWGGTGGRNRFLIHNNIIALRTLSNTGIVFYAQEDHQSTLMLYNNTIITHNWTPVSITNVDTVIIKNNILYVDTALGQPNLYFADPGFAHITYKSIDFNQYCRPSGDCFVDTNTAGVTHVNIAMWRTMGYDINGDTSKVTFVNRWGTNANDYKLIAGSIGINAGITVGGIPAIDISGTARPQGVAWDKGAYELPQTVTNYSLGLSINGNGYTSPTAGSSGSYYYYDSASSITVTAYANIGSHFVNWTQDDLGDIQVSTDGGYTFTITADLGLTAHFALNTPDIPALLSPTNNQTSISVSPTLQWDYANYATSYHAETSTSKTIKSDGGFVTRRDSTWTTSTVFPITGLTNSTKYYWHAKSLNSADSSAWAVVDSFTTITGSTLPDDPTLVYPVGITNQPMIINATWTGNGASTDSIRIYKVVGGVNVLYLPSIITPLINKYTISLDAIATQYAWQVRAGNGYGWTAWSALVYFTTLTCH
jgi:Divergent InlB B-repeat domain